MDELEALRQLAARHDIEPGYVDFAGATRDTSPDTLVAVLRALGMEIDGPADAPRLLDDATAADASPLVPSVVVAWDRDPVRAPLRVPSRAPNRVVECGVRLERGGTVEWRTRVSELEVAHADGDATVRLLEVPEPLPWGVHHLRVVVGDQADECIVVTAPRRGARSGTLADGAAWGAFVPLHALRTGRSGATGDLGDLRELADVLAEDGAPTARPAVDSGTSSTSTSSRSPTCASTPTRPRSSRAPVSRTSTARCANFRPSTTSAAPRCAARCSNSSPPASPTAPRGASPRSATSSPITPR